jgi:predicted nucleotidyltransferase
MISQAIIQTLKYSDYFDFPLTQAELTTRLIRAKATNKDLSSILDNLVNNQQIIRSKKYYALVGREALFTLRDQRKQISQVKRKLAEKYASSLARVPGVIAIYLTGSLAVNNSTADDDIDFMVITRDGWLWRTRLLLTLLSEFRGIRRQPGGKSANNKLCLNLYLSESTLSIPPGKRSLYTAYELIQAQPLFDPANTRTRLLQDNSWLTAYLPNYNFPSGKNQATKDIVSINPLEDLAYKLQRLYMSKKLTTEYITKKAAFFHPRSPAPPTSTVK